MLNAIAPPLLQLIKQALNLFAHDNNPPKNI